MEADDGESIQSESVGQEIRHRLLRVPLEATTVVRRMANKGASSPPNSTVAAWMLRTLGWEGFLHRASRRAAVPHGS
ncbi:MAG: hypothetical protein M1131_02780 [Actinobacteria bacterium]|nr:hypothetical protein [Actinomycetota bacterium]MCL6095993.1 hypothetical protein [Actinomycetota bacterium]